MKLIDARRHHFTPSTGTTTDVYPASTSFGQELPRKNAEMTLEDLCSFIRSDRFHGKAVPKIPEGTYGFGVNIAHYFSLCGPSQFFAALFSICKSPIPNNY